MHTISGRLCSITGRLDRKIPQDFASFILQQWVRNKFLPFAITFYVGIFCIAAHGFLATLSRLFQYCFFGRLGQMLMVCVKISTFPLQSLQSAVSMVLSVLYFTELVLIASQRRLPVFLFSSPFLDHSHFLLSLWHYIYVTNCPWSAFPFHSLLCWVSFLTLCCILC